MHDFLEKVWEKFVMYLVFPLMIAACIWIFQKWSRYIETQRKHFKFAKTSVRDQMIKEALIELRVLLGADRVYVTMFHNGSSYVDGSHDNKKSRTHEVVGPGVSYENQNYQDIRLSLMNDEIDLLKGEAQPTFTTFEQLKDSKFRRMLSAQGVRGIARCPLRDHKNVIGFIGADFPTDIQPPNLIILCDYIGRIEEIMSRYRHE
jgi:hypothetical protein